MEGEGEAIVDTITLTVDSVLNIRVSEWGNAINRDINRRKRRMGDYAHVKRGES